MRRVTLCIIMVLLILTITACSNTGVNEDIVYYETAKEAIDNGLDKGDMLLSVEEYKEDTIVFFDRDEALGAALLVETKKGFGLVRSNPLIGFEGDVDYSTGSFNMTITGGETIEILVGKVFRPEISKIMIEKINNPAVEIWAREKAKSKLFYYILDGKYIDHKISAVKD